MPRRKRLHWTSALIAAVALVTLGAIVLSQDESHPRTQPSAMTAQPDSRLRGLTATQSPARTLSPIRHVIVICQENHSFDNYFGTYPNAPGFVPLPGTPVVDALPADASNKDLQGREVRPFALTTPVTPDLPHGYADMLEEINHGAMDGYVRVNERAAITQANHLSPRTKSSEHNHKGAHVARRQTNTAWVTLPMGHYDYRVIGPYWNYAQHFTLADHWFAPVVGPTTTNVLYMVAARAGDWHGLVFYTQKPPKEGIYTFPNIGDQLTRHHVSWAWYQGGSVTGSMDNPFPFFRNFNKGAYRGHIRPISAFPADLKRGDVPAVVFLKPNGQDEHPGTNVLSGVRFVVQTVNAIMRSSIWQSSVIILTYDESGGWYDHVSPPDMTRYSVDGLTGDGPRVPTLILSPFVAENAVTHEVYDTTSILRFIEWNWKLPPLNRRVAATPNLVRVFDFRHPNPVPLLLPVPGADTVSAPPRGYIAARVRLNNFPLGSTGVPGPFWWAGHVYVALADLARNLNAPVYPSLNGQTMEWLGHRYTFLASEHQLLIDGERWPETVRMLDLDGVIFVPVETVSRAMGLDVTKMSGGVQLYTQVAHEII